MGCKTMIYVYGAAILLHQSLIHCNRGFLVRGCERVAGQYCFLSLCHIVLFIIILLSTYCIFMLYHLFIIL